MPADVQEHRGEPNSALVVDNEPPVRAMVKSILAKVGFHVVESDHGAHALSLLTANPCFDLLLTETQPPGVDASTLTAAFLLKCPFGRAILLSGHEDTAEINAESNGAWAVLCKNRLADELLEAIRALGLAHRQRTVLVVEDEPMVRNFVRFVLVKAGYVVLDASDGQEALELCRAYQKAIDLVLSDIVMPRMTGPEFVEQIRQERPNIPVLFMSGHASGALQEYATGDNFVMKPFIPKVLTDKITEVLNRRSNGGTVARM